MIKPVRLDNKNKRNRKAIFFPFFPFRKILGSLCGGGFPGGPNTPLLLGSIPCTVSSAWIGTSLWLSLGLTGSGEDYTVPASGISGPAASAVGTSKIRSPPLKSSQLRITIPRLCCEKAHASQVQPHGGRCTRHRMCEGVSHLRPYSPSRYHVEWRKKPCPNWRIVNKERSFVI